MKDLYTFDMDMREATTTYDSVLDAYSNLFDRIGVPWKMVDGDCGDIGGIKSHEFHFPAEIGQDSLLVCSQCKAGMNTEIDNTSNLRICAECGGPMISSKGIEVAHAFLLSDTYTSKLQATYKGADKNTNFLQMGCYGIGVSRLLGACVEVLSTRQELRWPKLFVPFSACVICPKAGSREESVMPFVHELYDTLVEQKGIFHDDVVLDDRDNATVGRKLRDAYKMGYSYIILFGKESIDENNPLIELHRPTIVSDEGYMKHPVIKVPFADINSVLCDMLKSTS